MSYRADEVFVSTAPYYARFRPGYPDEVFQILVRHFGLGPNHTVLDLGCGTGQLTFGLADHVGAVLGVDPAQEMLAEAERIADERGVANVSFQLGDSSRLSELGRRFYLVTMGASFHWMDRDATLAVLDTMVDGGVAVISGGRAAEQPPAWEAAIAEVRSRWLGHRRRAGSGTYEHPADRHETVLARSPFSEVTAMRVPWHLEQTIEEVVGLQFSYSYSAPALFDGRAERFAAELRQVLAGFTDNGRFSQEMCTEMLLARRPSA